MGGVRDRFRAEKKTFLQKSRFTVNARRPHTHTHTHTQTDTHAFVSAPPGASSACLPSRMPRRPCPSPWKQPLPSTASEVPSVSSDSGPKARPVGGEGVVQPFGTAQHRSGLYSDRNIVDPRPKRRAPAEPVIITTTARSQVDRGHKRSRRNGLQEQTDRALGVLPECLCLLGNRRSWEAVLKHLREATSRPLVVSGPTGCGKSQGCRALLTSLGAHVVVLDGSDGDGADDLVGMVRRVRLIRCNNRNECTVLVLDDFESFTEVARKALATYLVASRDDRTLSGVIITATEFRSQLVRPLHSLDHVRLVAPSVHVVREWMEQRHVWHRQVCGDTHCPPHSVEHRGFPTQYVDECIRTERRPGDLRRVAAALEWRCRMGECMQSLLSKGEQSYTNSFDSARMLFTRRVGWEWWVRHAQEWDVSLVQNNYHEFVACRSLTSTSTRGTWEEDTAVSTCGTAVSSTEPHVDGELARDVDPQEASDLSVVLSIATMSDVFSLGDTMRTRQFELGSYLMHARFATAALVIQWGVETRTVGALAPPAPHSRVSSVRGGTCVFECLNAA